MNELVAIGGLLGIYGALWLANTILAIRNNLNKGFTFQWPVFWDGVIRAALGAFALTIGAVALLYVPTVFEAAGISVGAETQKAISMLAVLGAIGAGVIIYARKFIKNVQELFNPENEVKPELVPEADNWNKGEVVLSVADLPEGHETAGETIGTDPIKKAVAEYLKENPAAAATALETDSGQGAAVTTSSPDAFRNAVLGRGYDIDGYYGWQCWDAAALFWYSAVGRTCSTGGTGAARGCWEAARSYNAGTEFELITDRNKIQKGDWLVFGGTQWGHIGMAMSGNLGNYVKLLGQNQGVGAANKNGGYAFSEVNMSLGNFLGAFRLKKWHKAPAPSPAPSAGNYKIVKTLNGYYTAADAKGRKNAKVTVAAGNYYVFNTASGMVNVTTKKGTPGSWINPGDNKKAAPAPSWKVGQTVTVAKPVDVNGTRLKVSGKYTIAELKGKRAVIKKGGVVVAAISTDNLRRA